MSDDIRFSLDQGVASVLLDRPRALNALTLEQIRALDPRLVAWAGDPAVRAVLIEGAGDKAFCAGGDVMHIYEAGLDAKAGRDEWTFVRTFFREEYSLNRRIYTFPRPYLALLDGVTMGGGVGLSVHGSHRVVTERTVFAMPETGIGLFPDVGGSWFLPRCPGELGTYLGLTGARLRAADLIYAGIGTHHLPSGALAALPQALRAADWAAGSPHAVVDGVLARLSTDPGPAPLAAHRAAIDRCFAHDRVEDILAALEADGSDFAVRARDDLAGKSPTSLRVTLEQLRRGRDLDFDGCMTMEYRLSQACLARHDFYEGIRALLIDRDNAPRWAPPDLAGVTDDMVAAHFASLGAEDLAFGAD